MDDSINSSLLSYSIFSIRYLQNKNPPDYPQGIVLADMVAVAIFRPATMVVLLLMILVLLVLLLV